MVRIIDRGPLWEIGGIANSHREYLKQIAKKHKVWLTDFPSLDFGNEFCDMFNSFKFNRYNHMMFLYGDTANWYNYANHDCIGYNVYEGDNPPTSWINNMNNSHIKEIWVPSNYVKETYINKGVIKPIKVVPHGINKNFKPINIKRKFKIINTKSNYNYIGIPLKSNGEDIFKDKFIFFGMGSIYGTGQRDRKGIDILLKAFEKAFKNNSDVCLIIKLNIKYAQGYYKKKGSGEFDLDTYLKRYISKNKNIYILLQDLEESELIRLYNAVDCGVFPHRSEGFGMIQQEMMACDKPVITTGYSGTNDTSQKHLRIKINGFKLAEFDNIDEQRYPYVGSKWPEPSLNHLVKLMKNMFKDFDTHKLLSEEYGKYIRKEFSWNKIGRYINSYINKKFRYKNPTKTPCPNCLKNGKKVYLIESENDGILRCPECFAWRNKK